MLSVPPYSETPAPRPVARHWPFPMDYPASAWWRMRAVRRDRRMDLRGRSCSPLLYFWFGFGFVFPAVLFGFDPHDDFAHEFPYVPLRLVEIGNLARIEVV